jgi:hypothetical protein
MLIRLQKEKEANNGITPSGSYCGLSPTASNV